MNKIIGTLFLGAILLMSCQPNKQESVKKLISAINNYDKQKISNLLTDDFVFTYQDGTKQDKQSYLNALDVLLEDYETKQSVVSIQNLDSIIKTEEQTVNVFDSILEVTPPMVQYKTYRFKDGKILSISLDSIANVDEYNKSLNEKMMSFAFWVKDTYDVEDLFEVIHTLKKYLTEYQELSVSEKNKFRNYSRLQGTYISKDNPLCRKLAFKGKTTVVITDAIFGWSSPTIYTLDEDYVRIQDGSVYYLLQIKDDNTLIGEGIMSGTFRKKE